MITVFGAWALFNFILNPLPFFSYFSDPELAYIYSSLELAKFGSVELTDHPGTFLQILGVPTAALASLNFEDAFDTDAIDRFRNIWLCFCSLSMIGCIYLLKKLTTNNLQLVCAMLLLFSDYNNLAFWGRFTPEGAFSALYLPILLFLVLRLHSANPISSKALLGWSILIGCVTTIKITLWPVSAFTWVLLACHGEGRTTFKIKRGVLVAAASLTAYFILGSIFANNRTEQIQWFLSLITNSGRYGGANQQGVFLPLSQIIDMTWRGLSLQNYTTLVPLILTSAAALTLVFRSGIKLSDRIVTISFVLCLTLSGLLYAKHPYQIKYLLPQSYLMLLFFLYLTKLKCDYPLALKAFLALMAGVAINSFSTYQTLHTHTHKHDLLVEQQIDDAIQQINPSNIYLSLEAHHPLTAQGFATRETKRLIPQFESQVRPSQIFRERAKDYTISKNSPLPLGSISPNSLIFTARSFLDPRVQHIYQDINLGLNIFYSPPDPSSTNE